MQEWPEMNRRYSLRSKIEALNEIDEHDGEVARVSEFLEIPARTLRGWLQDEEALRRAYRGRLKRQRERAKLDLQLEMLKRGRSHSGADGRGDAIEGAAQSIGQRLGQPGQPCAETGGGDRRD